MTKLSVAKSSAFVIASYVTFAALLALYLPFLARALSMASGPVSVVVHAAFAEASNWDAVVARLLADSAQRRP
jgi:hypothetical protein